MSTKSFGLPEPVYRYLLANSVRDTPLLRELREITATLPMARMQISPEQGQFMALLVKLIGARRCIEVGVFTGYSSLSVAQALPADGRIVACDVNEEWSAIARRFWEKGGVAGKITLHLAPATDTLDKLLAGGEAGKYDFAFIDADKSNYRAYYERCLSLVRAGRAGGDRQHALVGQRRRPRGQRRRHARDPRAECLPAHRFAGRTVDAAGGRRADAGVEALARRDPGAHFG